MAEKNVASSRGPQAPGESHFLAILSRMKYIERWSLMRSSRPENLSEHSLEVALIAHMLCVIGNARFGRALDAERAREAALIMGSRVSFDEMGGQDMSVQAVVK